MNKNEDEDNSLEELKSTSASGKIEDVNYSILIYNDTFRIF